MAHLEMPDSGHIQRIADEYFGEKTNKEPHFLTERELVALIRSKYEDKVVGQGSECIVVPVEGREDLVAAYTYNAFTPVEAREVFYVQRVLSTLFPHNFPKFYATFGSQLPPEVDKRGTRSNRLTGSIRHRIIGEPQEPPSTHNEYLEDHGSGYSNEVKFSFGQVKREIEKMGFRLSADEYEGNFILGSDGGEYFVDTTAHNAEKIVEHSQTILEYMDSKNYSADDKRLMRAALGRLAVLRTE